MKFSFDIPDEEFEDFYGAFDFKNLVIKEAASQIIDRVYNDLDYDTREIVRDVIKKHKQEIVDKVIALTENKLSDSISRKKAIVEITPKASELSAIDKENEKYFMSLIDKAIAKRFK